MSTCRTAALSILLAGLFVLVMLPGTSEALQPPHDASNGIDCYDCHALFDPVWSLLPRDAEQEARCRTCHNPTGQASTMPDVANHVVNGGATIVDCGCCHNVHYPIQTTDAHSGQTGYNLKLIRSDPSAYVPVAVGPLVFQQNPNHYSFDTAPYNGLCQGCHTQTLHHRNNGQNPNHFSAMLCVTCHAHNDEFAPSGCLDCHDQPQGPRRQIVETGGDFQGTSHHILGTPEDDDCSECHYMGDHQSGVVKLVDPDLGGALVHDYSVLGPAGLEDFCLACHDSDGAAAGNGLVPFSDGQTVPNIAGPADSTGPTRATWNSSVHRTRGYSLNGNSPLTCMGDGLIDGCHDSNAHGSSNEKLMSTDQGALTVSGLCYNCHTEGRVMNDALTGTVDDIQQAFSQGSRHNLGTSFSVGGRTYELQCTSCHNPHVVTGKHWEVDQGLSPVTLPDLSADPATNPRAMSKGHWGAWGDEPGEKMDDYAGSATGSGGWYYSIARGGAIIFDQPAVYQPMKAEGFDGTTNRVHEFDGDVLPDYATFCLYCHDYNMGGQSQGAVNWNGVQHHGRSSANRPSYWGDVGLYGNSGNSDPIFDEPNVTRGRGAGHFMRWPYDSVHKNAGINFVMSCTDCHEAHGSGVSSFLRTVVNNGPGSWVWNTMCNNCHYYYGGHHAGMSCGTAAGCHPHQAQNSIHRGSGTGSGATYLWTEPSRPTYTPEILQVDGTLGSNDLNVIFSEGVFTNSDSTGSIIPEDLLLTDVNGDNPKTIGGIVHNPGDQSATVTMTAPLTIDDWNVDLLATRGVSVWDGDGDPAGPWTVPIGLGGTCPTGETVFLLDETSGSYTYDEQGILVSTAGNPSLSFPGDGYYHGDEDQATYISIDSNARCLQEANTITVEARFFPTGVDLDYIDSGQGGADANTARNATFNRIFDRKRSIMITVMRADYGGDNVPSRDERARIQIKYRVDSASHHTCPNPAYADTWTGTSAWWHQISTDIDVYPIVNDHWYQMKVVFATGKPALPSTTYRTPVDIFLDDQGTDGFETGEMWAGWVNAAMPDIQDSSPCRWGAKPDDTILLEDQFATIGENANHNSIPGNSGNQIFKGLIDWVTWAPVADYSGVGGAQPY